jgi:hypothetical protein
MRRIRESSRISTLRQETIELRRKMSVVFLWGFISRGALLCLGARRLARWNSGSWDGESSQLSGVDGILLVLLFRYGRSEVVIESQGALVVRAFVIIIIVVVKLLDWGELRRTS